MGSMTVSQDEAIERVYNIGSTIPLKCFQIIPGLIFGIAMISIAARSGMRFWTRRPLYWDDLVLAIGAITYIIGTTLFYMDVYNFYLQHALQEDMTLLLQVSQADISNLMNYGLSRRSAWNIVTWTTIFCVKASFLIIIKQLLKRIRWLIIYFWFVAGFTFVSWVITMSGQLIVCPYTGWNTLQCNNRSRDSLQLGTMAGVTTSDVLSDVMIVSIPIMILWRSQLDPKQKIIIGPFLCLSLFMIAFSILRISRYRGVTETDFVWMAFWQHIEAGIALIVTSIATIRTVFTARKHRKIQPPGSAHLLLNIGGTTRKQQKSEEEKNSVDLPKPCKIVVKDSWEVEYT